MKKKYIISLTILTVLGSLFTAFAWNMLCDDIFNKDVALANMTFFVTLPAVSVAITFVLAILYVIRTYKHPNCKKRITRLYLILAIIFAVIGVIGDILGGVKVYGTFTGPNPFPGYLIIFLIINTLLIVGAGIGLYLVSKKMPQDEDKVKVGVLYVLKTIGWVLFIGMVLSRLGMFLALPFYVYLRNLYLTFPTYLYLLVPLFIGVIEILDIFGLVKKKTLFILSLVSLGLNVVLCVYTVLMGLNSTAYISSISQIYPIDRMLTLPVEIVIHFLFFLVGNMVVIIQNRNSNKA